jgi:hypothetical protein
MKPLAVIRTDGPTERVGPLDRDLGRIDSLGRPIGGVESIPLSKRSAILIQKTSEAARISTRRVILNRIFTITPKTSRWDSLGSGVVVAVSRADCHLNGAAGEESKLAGSRVNARPGPTETSPAPDRTAYAGFSFDEPVAWTMEDAGCDC